MEMSIIAFTLKMIAGSLVIRYKCEMSFNSSPTHRNFHLKSPTKKLALAKTNQHSTTNFFKKKPSIYLRVTLLAMAYSFRTVFCLHECSHPKPQIVQLHVQHKEFSLINKSLFIFSQ